jgi:DNA integrity scanning protein DisA with diadenylate cyclase activity
LFIVIEITAMTESKSNPETKPKVTKTTRKGTTNNWEREARTINRLMLESAGKVALHVKARALFIYVDACRDPLSIEKIAKKVNLVFVTKGEKALPEEFRKSPRHILKIPNIGLTRMGHIKVAAVMAINADMLDHGDKAVFLSGVPELGTLDSIMVLDIGREFEMISSSDVRSLAENVKPAIFEAVLNLAVELAHEGREGKSVGTTFIIGDVETVLSRSRQLTINPFRGYSEDERNILDPDVRETLKEFSSIDGAFLIREDGVVVTAGRHLNAAFEEESLPQGLGSRHASAAGITSVSNATAIVVSESTGDLRIFRHGKIFLTIEKSAR